jgi:hypothetical protein
MVENLTLESICVPSSDVVVRDIEGDTLIVPLISGIGEADDELYTVNETGQAILRNLDGTRTLRQVSETLVQEFDSSVDNIGDDVLGFVSEMVKRKILVLKE